MVTVHRPRRIFSVQDIPLDAINGQLCPGAIARRGFAIGRWTYDESETDGC